MRYRLFFLLVSMFEYAILHAAGSVPEVAVWEQGGVYQIRVTVIVNQTADNVRHVLTDYGHIYRLNPSIIESKVLGANVEGYTLVRTKMLGCAGYFCHEMERVEKIKLLPSGDLVAEIIPDSSDFRSGRTTWHIEELGERCRVSYESTMEPDFYIPPIVGSFMAKKSIRTEVAMILAQVEQIAGVMAERN